MERLFDRKTSILMLILPIVPEKNFSVLILKNEQVILIEEIQAIVDSAIHVKILNKQ
jgi:hypothetical protein